MCDYNVKKMVARVNGASVFVFDAIEREKTWKNCFDCPCKTGIDEDHILFDAV